MLSFQRTVPGLVSILTVCLLLVSIGLPAKALGASSCFWLSNQTNTWQAMPHLATKKQCYEQDSCNGGLGRSGGGCYKWAKSAQHERERWQSAAPDANLEKTCFDAVQGKVAWNRAGNTSWSGSNIRNLCAGTTDPAATIACFEAQISQHDDWVQAIAACQTGAAAPPDSTPGDVADDDDGIVYEDVPDMPQADIDAVMQWISYETQTERLPYCYKDSEGRGVGEVPDSCANSGLEKDRTGGPAGLCYPKCKNNYTGVGPVCWQSCPSGFRDDGAFCAKPAAYGRGVGRIPDVKCPRGFSQRGIGAAAWCDNGPTWPWDLQVKSASITCKSSEDRDGGLCYPKCKKGFTAVGCCTCSPICPAGMGTDIGVSCTKKSYGRGVGELSTCPAGTVRDETGGPAGLCFPKCKAGFNGVGPVCWQSCPASWTDCGAGCAKSAGVCAETTFDQTFSVAMVGVNVATLGLATPGTAAAGTAARTVQVAGKAVTASTKSGRALINAANALKKATSQGKKVVRIAKRKYNAKTGRALDNDFDTVQLAHDLSNEAYNSASDFYTAYADDFADNTSDAINDTIDSKFHPRTARFLKRSWASIQLTEMAQANNWTIAQDTLSVVSVVDISGVTAVASAFTKPVCEKHRPWPKLSRSYR